MNEYQGAVAFIDLLGMGALTRGKVNLISEDFASIQLTKQKKQSHHLFSAKLLAEFRSALIATKNFHADVEIAQLSDCAFLWSKTPFSLVDAARHFMWKATRAGLLCRGGLAFGGIVEPDKVRVSIGRFILGEAVTKAVELERSGKGCRLFSDQDLPSELSSQCARLGKLFAGIKNPLDCSIVDELRWYLYPNSLADHLSHDVSIQERILAATEIELKLRFSPLFRWNITSVEGEIQIAASIETISKCAAELEPTADYSSSSEYLIGHLHKKRSAEIYQSVLKTRQSYIDSHFRRSANSQRKKQKISFTPH